MKKLFGAAERYLRISDWRDLALLKFCVGAMGVLLGLCVPQRHKKQAGLLAALVFAGTYLPLMAKFLPCLDLEEAHDDE